MLRGAEHTATERNRNVFQICFQIDVTWNIVSNNYISLIFRYCFTDFGTITVSLQQYAERVDLVWLPEQYSHVSALYNYASVKGRRGNEETKET